MVKSPELNSRIDRVTHWRSLSEWAMLPSAKARFLGGCPLGRNQDPKGGEAEAERRRAAGRMKSPEACDRTSKGEARETSASWIASPKISSYATLHSTTRNRPAPTCTRSRRTDWPNRRPCVALDCQSAEDPRVHILAGKMCAALDIKTSSLWEVRLLLLERLVGPEADDSQSQRIYGQFVVLDFVPEDVGDAGGPLLPLEHGVVRWVREYSLELNTRRIG